MSLLDQYIEELKQDTHVDQMNVKNVQLSLPALKHKWSGKLVRHKQEILHLKRQKEQKQKELAEAIQAKAPVKMQPYQLDKTVNQAEQIIEINHRVEELELLIDLLERTEKTLASMTYDIGNICKLITLETM